MNLVPPDADVRGFSEMPMEVMRLLDSETWIMCTPEERSAAINLWFRAWVQVPAGSLPDNDRVLSHLSMAGERWADVREMALRGWVKGDDGRLYHPVVCEKVNKLLEVRKQKRAAGSAGGSARKPAARKPRKHNEASAKQPLSERQASDKPLLSSSLLSTPPDVKEDGDKRASLDRLEAALREAAGAALDPTSTGLMVLDRPLAWAEGGCDLDTDVLPAIRAAAARASPQSIRSWKYFDRAVADAYARRTAPMPEGNPNGTTRETGQGRINAELAALASSGRH